jgi:hypothetical protein
VRSRPEEAKLAAMLQHWPLAHAPTAVTQMRRCPGERGRGFRRPERILKHQGNGGLIYFVIVANASYASLLTYFITYAARGAKLDNKQ